MGGGGTDSCACAVCAPAPPITAGINAATSPAFTRVVVDTTGLPPANGCRATLARLLECEEGRRPATDTRRGDYGRWALRAAARGINRGTARRRARRRGQP